MAKGESAQNGAYDLMILTDATASMGAYLRSLRSSLPKILAMSALTNVFKRVGILAYRDYEGDLAWDTERPSGLTEWSGWKLPSDSSGKPNTELVSIAERLRPTGGGDYPEATQTGLARAYEVMRKDVTTIILLYTDAPPHSGEYTGENQQLEQKALSASDSYGGFGPSFTSWRKASETMAGKAGGKRSQIFSILCRSMDLEDGNFYTFLSTRTGGSCFYLKNTNEKSIAKLSVDVLVAWMGVEKIGAEATKLEASVVKYKNIPDFEATSEAPGGQLQGLVPSDLAISNTVEIQLDSEVLKQNIYRKEPPVEQFASRYQTDAWYKQVVVNHLKRLIEQDVSTISLNPVFGTLWRAVCNDRTNDQRNDLITSFGLAVDRITNADDKKRMKTWLEESYDYSAEVEEAIEQIPVSQRFPCVYLDPTIAFSKPEDTADQDEEDQRAITDFKRDELLEIGRSCDYRILRRLGKVLTRLIFVNSADELPAHVANAEQGQVTMIPMALASQEYGAKFWKMLLHIVVPGTMLAARPAALLAGLTIKLGIQPLFETAQIELLRQRDRWNNLEIPETWNVSCLSLLLDADRAYREKKSGQPEGKTGLLKESDRKLFDTLVSYKMLELNLKTTLTAKVGWKPEKSSIPLGPFVVCRSCKYPRSVTIVGDDGECGVCMSQYPTDLAREESIKAGANKHATEVTNAAWVECSIKTCRAQYVVYNVEHLNVRPKCHYCRQESSIAEEKRNPDPAPWLECHKCLNRVIYPKKYRLASNEAFECVSCTHKKTSIVSIETDPSRLREENGDAWLLSNADMKLESPFSGRSLFHQISKAGTENFASLVTLFPVPPADLHLTSDGKTIHNAADVLAQLQSWVLSRRTESGTCSLCFSSQRKNELHPACGRRGCAQAVCQSCLRSWYGLNAAGRLINLAALSCPFCRRAPAAKTLAGYGMGIHAVSGLKDAVANGGSWIYAWCADCAAAKQYLERVCARGAPPDVNGWICEQCEEKKTGKVVADMKVKICPNEKCGIMVNKMYGCNHISCVCGAHWCWECVTIPDIDIYQHMSIEHHGYYDEDDIEMDDEDEWSD